MTEIKEKMTRCMAFGFLFVLMVSIGFFLSMALRNEPKPDNHRHQELAAVNWPQPLRIIPQEAIALAARLEDVFENRDMMVKADGRRYAVQKFGVLAGAAWDGGNSVFPENVMKLNQRDVMFTGFMVPLNLEAGRASRFLLTRDLSFCSSGGHPNLDQIIAVTLDRAIDYMDRVPVAVCGHFTAGPFRDAQGRPGLYRLEADADAVMPVEALLASED